jgi:hypothetical protein
VKAGYAADESALSDYSGRSSAEPGTAGKSIMRFTFNQSID